MIVVVDGPRGSGKSTLIEELARRLVDFEPEVFINPLRVMRAKEANEMIVVVDGPRGAGKTTMVTDIYKQIEERLPTLEVEPFKSERPLNPFIQMHEAINCFLRQPDKVHLCDRFHLTEYVMSTTRGREPAKYLFDQIRMIDDRLAATDVVYIVLTVDPREIDIRLRQRTPFRDWDMPRDHMVLWDCAVGLSKVAEFMPNNSMAQYDEIVNTICQRIASNRPR